MRDVVCLNLDFHRKDLYAASFPHGPIHPSLDFLTLPFFCLFSALIRPQSVLIQLNKVLKVIIS